MQVIILAGGRGTRLPISAHEIPKPLVAVAGKPMVAHQIDALLGQGFPRVRLSLGHGADAITAWAKRYGDRVDWVVEPEPLGTGGAVKFASAGLREPFMVLNGDIVADFDYRAIRDEARAHENAIVGWELPDARDYGLLEVAHDGRIAAFREKPNELIAGIINAGIYVLQPGMFEGVPEKFSIEEFFSALAAEGRLGCVPHRGAYWFDCGTEERLAAARTFLGGRS